MQMMNPEYQFESLSTRESFNTSLRYFKLVTSIIEQMQEGDNLADVINRLLTEGAVSQVQILPLLQSLLVQKYLYEVSSLNLESVEKDLASIAAETSKWKAVDLLVLYHHPEVGTLVINPKRADQWELISSLRRHELMVVYVGAFSNTQSIRESKTGVTLIQNAVKKFFDLVQGLKGKVPVTLYEGKFSLKNLKPSAVAEPAKKKGPRPGAKSEKPGKAGAKGAVGSRVSAPAVAAPVVQARPQPSIPGGKLTKVGPLGVIVSNELFHNGNVEAWKRIIDSYAAKYPSSIVTIYYDGEVIKDINSLFKWGKVKHGTAIEFSVMGPGEKLNDVAKLKRYLTDGASSRFEQFLKGPVGKVLELF